MKQIASVLSRTQMIHSQWTYRCLRGKSPSSLSAYAKLWISQCVILQSANTGITLAGPITIWLYSDIPNVCEDAQIYVNPTVARFAHEFIKPGEKEPSSLLLLKEHRPNTSRVTLSKSGLEMMTPDWRAAYLNLHECPGHPV